jgi:hypothetical protein
MITLTSIFYILLFSSLFWAYKKYKIIGNDNFIQFLIDEGERCYKIWIIKKVLGLTILVNLVLFIGYLIYLILNYLP